METSETQSGRELISARNGSIVYRVREHGRTAILKVFDGSQHAVEPRAYRLLASLGVPTLEICRLSDCEILMEDLQASERWRPATGEDTKRPETGVAVAAWYRRLHEAGAELIAERGELPGFLTSQADALDAASIIALGQRLGLADNPVWSLAAERVEDLKTTLHSLPQTLTYSDFHWTNLALSRNGEPQAIVFDYHLLGIGPAYCDIRNVKGSLGKAAACAFAEAYGYVDERAEPVDAVLSVLYALLVASRLRKLPSWSAGLVETVTNGSLEFRLRAVTTMGSRK